MLLKKAIKNDMLKLYFLSIFLCVSFFIEAQVLNPTINYPKGCSIEILCFEKNLGPSAAI